MVCRTIAGYQRQRCSRFPEARLRVECGARPGTQRQWYPGISVPVIGSHINNMLSPPLRLAPTSRIGSLPPFNWTHPYWGIGEGLGEGRGRGRVP
eukprot:2874028-Pyramimonas_sp.AAC.1